LRVKLCLWRIIQKI